eukprot:Gb_41705 [translate_table: standard]
MSLVSFLLIMLHNFCFMVFIHGALKEPNTVGFNPSVFGTIFFAKNLVDECSVSGSGLLQGWGVSTWSGSIKVLGIDLKDSTVGSHRRCQTLVVPFCIRGVEGLYLVALHNICFAIKICGKATMPEVIGFWDIWATPIEPSIHSCGKCVQDLQTESRQTPLEENQSCNLKSAPEDRVKVTWRGQRDQVLRQAFTSEIRIQHCLFCWKADSESLDLDSWMTPFRADLSQILMVEVD